jgi:hypothetical protein
VKADDATPCAKFAGHGTYQLIKSISMNIKLLSTKPIVALGALATIGAGAGIGAIASAQTPTTTDSTGAATTATAHMPHVFGGFGGMGRGGPMGGRGSVGTVTAINGNTITITKQDGTTETIDASSATVSKIVTENVSDIQLGDRISASGTTSGTTVTAKHIMDGIPAAPTQSTTSTASSN